MIDRLLEVPSMVSLSMMALTAWRVAVFINREGGPFSFMKWIREAAGIDHLPHGTPLPALARFPATLFGCMWCLTFWTAIASFFLYVISPIIVVIGSLWAAATILEVLMNWLLWSRNFHFQRLDEIYSVEREVKGTEEYRNGHGDG